MKMSNKQVREFCSTANSKEWRDHVIAVVGFITEDKPFVRSLSKKGGADHFFRCFKTVDLVLVGWNHWANNEKQ